MAGGMKSNMKLPAGFTRQEYTINGVRTVVHVGGKGRPVVYWHGAGSWHGFDFASSGRKPTGSRPSGATNAG